MKLLRYSIAVLFVCLSVHIARAQTQAFEDTVQVEATVQESPAQITLHWVRDPAAQSYAIFRRELGQVTWVKVSTVTSDTFYLDSKVRVGTAYEYRLLETAKQGTTTYNPLGFIASGIRVPA
jgi:hypothetical protein